MTPGLVAVLIALAVLSAAYAILRPASDWSEYDKEEVEGSGEASSGFGRYVRPALNAAKSQTPQSLVNITYKKDAVEELLAKSGNPWRIAAHELPILQLLGAAVGATGFAVLSLSHVFPFPLVGVLLAGAILGYMLPKLLLSSRWSARRKEMNRTLPEALDLLNINMNSGQTFANALDATVKLLPPGVTRDELTRVSAELQAGRTLATALAGLLRRTPTDGVDAFTRALNQAQQTGTDLARTLNVQAEEARKQYVENVKVRAKKIESTLVIPIILLFLPAIFILIFAPSVTTLTQL